MSNFLVIFLARWQPRNYGTYLVHRRLCTVRSTSEVQQRKQFVPSTEAFKRVDLLTDFFFLAAFCETNLLNVMRKIGMIVL